MTERVRLVNMPRQMLSEFPGSFGVQGEQSQQPKPPTSWTLATAHRYAPAFPSVADIGNGYVSNFIGWGSQEGWRPKRKRKLQFCPRPVLRHSRTLPDTERGKSWSFRLHERNPLGRSTQLLVERCQAH